MKVQKRQIEWNFDEYREPALCYNCGQPTRCQDEKSRPLCAECKDERDDAREYEVKSGGR